MWGWGFTVSTRVKVGIWQYGVWAWPGEAQADYCGYIGCGRKGSDCSCQQPWPPGYYCFRSCVKGGGYLYAIDETTGAYSNPVSVYIGGCWH
jgi:hypothetical protein